MRLRARLPGTKLTLLSGGSTTGRTSDSEYLFRAGFLFWHVSRVRSVPWKVHLFADFVHALVTHYGIMQRFPQEKLVNFVHFLDCMRAGLVLRTIILRSTT